MSDRLGFTFLAWAEAAQPGTLAASVRSHRRNRTVDSRVKSAVRDIRNPKLLLIKFTLFIVLGVAAALVLVLRTPEPMTLLLLVTCVWAFARAYYFCFYVVERYLDEHVPYSGVMAALRAAWTSARSGRQRG